MLYNVQGKFWIQQEPCICNKCSPGFEMQPDMHFAGGHGKAIKKYAFWDLHFWGCQICKKSPFYDVKWRFFAYVHLSGIAVAIPGANFCDMHFLGTGNMQKISILRCKMEMFCIFSIFYE